MLPKAPLSPIPTGTDSITKFLIVTLCDAIESPCPDNEPSLVRVKPFPSRIMLSHETVIP
jgi:hypothetical protein